MGPALAFHRTDLHEAIVRALPANLVQFDCPYRPAFATEGDVLIGADGINSVVREQALGLRQIRYSGFTCWRGICQNPGITDVFEDWGGAARIGVVPLMGNRIYVFLVLAAPRCIPRLDSVTSIRYAFAHFASPVPAVLDALTESQLLHHDIEELEAPVWGRGATVLIGDAAHAMTPNLGQGASMAIEDALVLPHVVSAKDPASAIAIRRHARVAQIQRNSRRLGQIAHWQSPIAISLRNFLMRCVPHWAGQHHYRRLIEAGPAFD
jgi:2-polyprenyl-6-methoxyphenol hydroxylase-like FAD-dependent oxidoreductase